MFIKMFEALFKLDIYKAFALGQVLFLKRYTDGSTLKGRSQLSNNQNIIRL